MSTKGQGGSEPENPFDKELEDLPQDLRWREWMGRIEAVLFASATPVNRDDLARVVGQGASVEMLLDDIQAELAERPYELVQTANGWMFRTKKRFADAIKAAANIGDQTLAFTEMEMAKGHLWQRREPRSLGAVAVQGSDCEWSTRAAARCAAYLCDD